MDASVLAAFIALGLCIPLIVVAFGMRLLALRDLFEGGGRGRRDRDRRPKPPLGRNPYHLP